MEHGVVAFVELTGKTYQLRHERDVPRVMARAQEESPEWEDVQSGLRENQWELKRKDCSEALQC